jgi:hypothetical protein
MRKFWIIAVAAAWTAHASAGVVLETVERDPAAGTTNGTNVMRADDGRLRIDRYEEGKLVAVMIFKDDALHALDPADKTYAVLDRATIEKVAGVVNPALKEMQEQLAKMSPEQRAMVEQMMKGSLPSGLGEGRKKVRTVVATERSDRVAGLACTVYEIREDSELVREACVAPVQTVPGGPDFYAVLSRMGALMQEMLDAIDAPWLKDSVDDQWALVEELNGVPIRGREFKEGKPVLEVELERIAEEKAPAGSFEIPADYARRDLDQLR